MLNQAKTHLGILLKDWRRFSRALAASPGQDYLSLCNRYEHLAPAPSGPGYRCDWQWTSELHAARHWPGLGLRLMRRALADHPIRRQAGPDVATDQPDVSFIIGHRGTARLPHLLATIESIAGQQGVSIECLVVEQDTHSQVAGQLSDWVRHVHTPPPTADMPYCRSWTFNVGARLARGKVLVLHDNDMLVPADYSACILEHVQNGYDAVNLKRFIFYLQESHTAAIFSGESQPADQAPDYIIQNLEGGGSVAITRDGYHSIGGMDERFIGWGGEDNEFWDRIQTMKVWPYAYLPLVHLWHAAQPGKHQADNPTLQLQRELAKVPVMQRIQYLRQQEEQRSGRPEDMCS